MVYWTQEQTALTMRSCSGKQSDSFDCGCDFGTVFQKINMDGGTQMKKILAFILSLSLLAALTACGGNTPASTGSSAVASDPASAAVPETTQEAPAEAPASDQTAEASSAEPASAPEAEVVPANTIE